MTGSSRSSITASIVLFAVLVAAGGTLAFIKVRSIRAAAAAGQHGEPPVSVQSATARETSWQRLADLVGTVISTRSVQVSNELPGTISTIGFQSGAIVEPGAVLLTLDDSTERADLAAAEAGVHVAEASLDVAKTRAALAELELTRLRNAADASAASRIELDRAESESKRAGADRERAAAEVDLARARVDQTRSRLEKMTIRAPFRGRTGLRNVHEGQYLAEGTAIVSLEEVGEVIHLDFAIPQEYIPRVTPGTAVMASGEVFGEEPVRIEVVAVDAAVNNGTRNVRVRAVVDNGDDRLRPGMFVQIEVPVDAPLSVVVVPSTAVRRTSYADQVFVLEPAEAPGMLRAKQRFVRVGPTMGEDVVIREGLTAGEVVAADGAFKLRDGALVAAVGPASGAAPPAAVSGDDGAGPSTDGDAPAGVARVGASGGAGGSAAR